VRIGSDGSGRGGGGLVVVCEVDSRWAVGAVRGGASAGGGGGGGGGRRVGIEGLGEHGGRIWRDGGVEAARGGLVRLVRGIVQGWLLL